MIAKLTEITKNTEKKFIFSSSVFSVISVLSLFLVIGGCSSPSAANNKLRIENQQLQTQLDAAKTEIETNRATIHSLESKTGTLPTLPQDRLEKLFTTASIKLGKLTSGDNWDSTKPADTGIKVQVTPIDGQGDQLKSAGSFSIDAFDLDQPDGTRIGHWTFDAAESRQRWFGGALLYAYVFQLPWQTIPTRHELTLKVTFTDELTGRQFTKQQPIKVNPPTPIATKSATKPISQP